VPSPTAKPPYPVQKPSAAAAFFSRFPHLFQQRHQFGPSAALLCEQQGFERPIELVRRVESRERVTDSDSTTSQFRALGWSGGYFDLSTGGTAGQPPTACSAIPVKPTTAQLLNHS
jgi:hypothetical protein